MIESTDESAGDRLRHTLEPIVELDAGEILSFEVLSLLGNRPFPDKTDPKEYQQATQALLLTRQLEFFQKISQYDGALYQSLFLNVDPALFGGRISWMDFLPFLYQFKIDIGFEMAQVLNGLSTQVMQAMEPLRALGIRFWIMDANQAIHALPAELRTCFDGIKIAKQCFWQCYGRADPAFIEQASSTWGHDNVIVEGVENRHHLSFVRAQGIMRGQGFHWRARLLRHACWH